MCILCALRRLADDGVVALAPIAVRPADFDSMDEMMEFVTDAVKARIADFMEAISSDDEADEDSDGKSSDDDPMDSDEFREAWV